MMGQIVSRPLIGSVLAMTLGLGTGCSHWIELARLHRRRTAYQRHGGHRCTSASPA